MLRSDVCEDRDPFLNTLIVSSISPTFLSISLLSNVSYYIPKPLWDSNVFILACMPWILTTMILSNCYQSLVISEINAPMGGQKLKNVSKYTICENSTILLVNPNISVEILGSEIMAFQGFLGLSETLGDSDIAKTSKAIIKQ